MTNAAIYCRISDDREGRAVGVATQEKDCRALAERRGWDVVEVFVDNDRSAWKRNRKRPGWDRLMAGLTDKAYEALVVFHGDRLMRQPRDLEDLLDIADRGVQLASPGGQRDLSDPDDRFILRIEVAHACRSSDDTSRRVKRAHLRLAEEGRTSGGGHRPFGFQADRSMIDAGEAVLVREAAERLLAGASLRGLVADWNTRGLGSVTGVPWTTTVLRRLVTSGRVCGWREHHGVLVAEATWPAILDRATVERLRGLLLDPGRRVNQNPRSYLLTGLARCGLCGAKLVARPRDDRRRCYVCASGPNFLGCGKIRVLAEPLEDWVSEMACMRLDGPELAANIGATPTVDEAAVMADIEACEAKLAELAHAWAADELSRFEWMAARQAVDARLTAARRLLVGSDSPRPLDSLAGQGATLWAGWEAMPFDRRRPIIEAALEAVIVETAVRGRNYFDRARIDPRWRG